MPRTQSSAGLKVNTDLDGLLAATVLLLSDDEALMDVVRRTVGRPWKLVCQGAHRYLSHRVFTQPNVRLVILDDQAVEESDHSWLLAQIRKHFSGASLLYVAASQSDGNEKRARANGAHYYTSKPLSLERFGYVLRSFLRAQQVKDEVYDRCST
jgi:DNA-binding response OmpR family regulator